MTLIVGIKCSNGVVLGSDGAATYSVLGTHTIRQPVRNKLQIRRECLVVGVSGPVGLGQRFTQAVEDLWDNKKLSGCSPSAAMQFLAESFRPHILSEMDVAKRARELIGQAALAPALSQTLVAAPVRKEPCLFQFDQQGAPEMATSDLPFVAVGSGQTIADPFLALLRRLSWSDREPTLGEATFAVVWTLRHAIEANAGGVADPMQVVWLEANGKARQLPAEELQEHEQRITETERILTDQILGRGPAGAVPEPVPEADST